MSPLESATQLMTNWATVGLLKGLTPDELRGKTLDLVIGLQGAVAPPKRQRKAKAAETVTETPKPVHVDMKEDAPW